MRKNQTGDLVTSKNLIGFGASLKSSRFFLQTKDCSKRSHPGTENDVAELVEFAGKGGR